jgi:uncharacterized protein YgbK (DUF1537 family)
MSNKRERSDNTPGSQNRPAARPLLIIADDLTGAADAAVPFAAIGRSVRVHLENNSSNTSDILAISTESRDSSPADAHQHLQAIARQLPKDLEVFKKVDSVFRGNTIIELCAALDTIPFDLAVVSPAYPALGRRMTNGVLHLQDIAGHQQVPVFELLANRGHRLHHIQAGLAPEAIEQQMRSALATSSRSVLCDAAGQSDLLHTVRAARSLEARILWVGSGGLAHALAAQDSASQHSETDVSPEGNIVFFVGSHHPVTEAQVVHLLQSHCIHEASFDTPLPAGGSSLLRIMCGHTSADSIQQALANLSPSIVSCLFMTGGETASLVCRSLGVKSLRLLREFAPGVPLGLAEGGVFDGVHIILKSGGFGEADLMTRSFNEFARTAKVAS